MQSVLNLIRKQNIERAFERVGQEKNVEKDAEDAEEAERFSSFDLAIRTIV